MSDEELDKKIESYYASLEKRTGLSRREIEYRSLLFLNWSMDMAVEGGKIGVRKSENGKSFFYRPNLDILEKIYQQQ